MASTLVGVIGSGTNPPAGAARSISKTEFIGRSSLQRMWPSIAGHAPATYATPEN